MKLIQQIAAQFREVFLDGQWVATNFREQLADVDLEMATARVDGLNTIADLAFHVDYYVAGIAQVLEGGSLDIRDKHSFDRPPMESAADWERFREKFFLNAERFADLLENMPEERLWADFAGEQYGNYYRNLHAMIEHAFYHLGQIVLLKKLISGRT